MSITTSKWRRAAVPAAMVLALVAIPACSSDDNKTSTGTGDTTANTKPVEAAVTVGDPWARSSASNAKAGAVYLTLTANDGDDELMKASVDSSVAKEAQVHETVTADSGDMSGTTMAGDHDMSGTTMAGDHNMTDDTAMSGAMTMREVESIKLPKGETVELKPGGYHIMLMDLVAPLEVGQKIKVTLTFEKAAPITVEAEVREG